MGSQCNFYPVVHIKPFWMMVHLSAVTDCHRQKQIQKGWSAIEDRRKGATVGRKRDGEGRKKKGEGRLKRQG